MGGVCDVVAQSGSYSCGGAAQDGCRFCGEAGAVASEWWQLMAQLAAMLYGPHSRL